jgi:Tat protein secretion system quality control protein TatD with DNase activity
MAPPDASQWPGLLRWSENAHEGEINHPGNLRPAFECLVQLRGESSSDLAARLEENFFTFTGWSAKQLGEKPERAQPG